VLEAMMKSRKQLCVKKTSKKFEECAVLCGESCVVFEAMMKDDEYVIQLPCAMA
jgi:hypothetical protein